MEGFLIFQIEVWYGIIARVGKQSYGFFCRIVILFVSDFGAHPKMFAQYKRCEWKVAK